MKPTTNQLQNKSTVSGTTVTDALNTLKTTITASSGDMLKSVYDTNDNGIVNAAETVPWSGVTSKPATFPPSSHTHTAVEISDSSSVGRSVLTAVDAAAARTALGVGSGSGDVVGPASAVNNNFAAFNTTTGKLIKDSGSSAASFEPAITAGTVSQFWSGTKTWRDLATDVRAVVLTGLSTATSTVVAATDTLLVAIGKLQAQVTLRAPIASPSFTGTSTFQGVRETTLSASTGTAYTIANSANSILILTLTGNCVFTFPAASSGGQFTLLLTQDATGSRTVTWPTAVRWAGGTTPTITATANQTDVISFVSDGTFWLGFVGGQNYTRA